MTESLKILIAASEVHPFAKTGGLADMTASIAVALKKLGHDVRIILPKYKSVEKALIPLKQHPKNLVIPVGKKTVSGTLKIGNFQYDIPVYFVENESYFNRDYLYGDSNGDYPDNAARFIFFSHAILHACKALGFQPDIIHGHDWQTGLVPVYLKSIYSKDSFFKNTRSVFSIHNIGYQGNFWHFDIPLANLPWELFTAEGVEFFGKFSFLKSGLVFADLLTTVSPTYGKEIQTPEFGFKMDGLLQHRSESLYGVLNGVDYGQWDPRIDPDIAQNFSCEDLTGKRTCKEELLQEYDLELPDDAMLVTMVTRLSHQKGLDLVMDVLDDLMKENIGFLLLGQGDFAIEQYFEELPQRFPGKAQARIDFNEKEAHKMIAGSDMILMPSRYEPCGLAQIYGLKYGTVPLVRSVGGLKDSIKEFEPNSKEGTGFLFEQFGKETFLKAFKKALRVYKNPQTWKQLMDNGMKQDFSWDQSALKYEALYKKALREPVEPFQMPAKQNQ